MKNFYYYPTTNRNCDNNNNNSNNNDDDNSASYSCATKNYMNKCNKIYSGLVRTN